MEGDGWEEWGGGRAECKRGVVVVQVKLRL